jgi:uncharacterized protein (TIGR03435 family)
MRRLIWSGAFAICCCSVNAQDAGSKVTFEVASVKPSPPLESTSGRATPTGVPGPGRYERRNARLTELIMVAYGLKAYQVLGPPWLLTERYEISAKLPNGATKNQVPVMLQALLADRFHLQAHRETREMPAYELVIAKGGPKFKGSTLEPESQAGTPPSKPNIDSDGFPVLPRNGGQAMGVSQTGRELLALRGDLTMEGLIAILSTQVDRPLTDQTGLRGNYDIAVHWAPETPDTNDNGAPTSSTPLPNLFAALQAQLGLKLESKRSEVQVLVVDHADKIPTAN